MNILSFFQSLFIEKKCYACRKLWHFFCLDCNSSVKVYEPYCYICKKPSKGFKIHNCCHKDSPIEQIIVLTQYRDSNIKTILKQWKYYMKYQVYRDLIYNNQDFFTQYIDVNNSIFIPVPTHIFRYWKRWYNHSQKIAQYLWEMLDIYVNNNLVYKKRYTKSQSKLTQQWRKTNLNNSFWIRKNKSFPKNTTIYIVDDIISTGSTVYELTRTLKQGWFLNIRVIALASD